MQHCKKLLAIGSDAVECNSPSNMDAPNLPSSLFEQLREMLLSKNGFYAFESALLVRPWSSEGGVLGIMQWNQLSLWKSGYQDMMPEALFFAEDVFCSQFYLSDTGVWRFDSETAGTEYMASDLDVWARLILEDYEILTGYPLAHQWQKENGSLKVGARLVPKVPFVAGGNFDTKNLYSLADIDAMRLMANFALQIRDVPDGGTISIDITD